MTCPHFNNAGGGAKRAKSERADPTAARPAAGATRPELPPIVLMAGRPSVTRVTTARCDPEDRSAPPHRGGGSRQGPRRGSGAGDLALPTTTAELRRRSFGDLDSAHEVRSSPRPQHGRWAHSHRSRR